MALVDLVNVRQGTRSVFELSHGNTLPITAVPFGANHWSPQTQSGRWFFHPDDRELRGIRLTHQPSPWMGEWCGWLITGAVGRSRNAGRPSAWRSDLAHLSPWLMAIPRSERRPYQALAPTAHGAVMEFGWEAGQRGTITFRSVGGPARLEADGSHLVGFTSAGAGGMAWGFGQHVRVTLDPPPDRWEPTDGEDWVGNRSGVGMIAHYNRPEGRVTARFATSFISAEQAATSGAAQLRGTVRETAERARAEWEAAFTRVELIEANPRHEQTFASCFYRTLLFPREIHEPGPSGPIHRNPYTGKVGQGPMVTDNGFWDTFRTVAPLHGFLFPERAAAFAEGWMTAAETGGWMPRWASPGYRDCMIGTHANALLADWLGAGVPIDPQRAWAASRPDCFTAPDDGQVGRLGLEHYISHGWVGVEDADSAASRTQEYAYLDWCSSRLADAAGDPDAAAELRRRSSNWRNAWDPRVGFMRGRHRADGPRRGAFVEHFDPLWWDNRSYVEGGAWQSSWAVPHDPAALIGLVGGGEELVQRLGGMLTMPPHFRTALGPHRGYGGVIHEMAEMAAADFGQYAHSNQPVHHVLGFFSHAGRPDLYRAWVRRVSRELYGPGDDGFCGDEDNGEMAAWYVWQSLGLFPFCPGSDELLLGAPLSDAVVNLPGGTLEVHPPQGQRLPAVWALDGIEQGVAVSRNRLARGGLLTGH